MAPETSDTTDNLSVFGMRLNYFLSLHGVPTVSDGFWDLLPLSFGLGSGRGLAAQASSTCGPTQKKLYITNTKLTKYY